MLDALEKARVRYEEQLMSNKRQEQQYTQDVTRYQSDNAHYYQEIEAQKSQQLEQNKHVLEM